MAAITPDLVAQHQITPEEYKKILKLLGREPTLTELGIFSVMWSEHLQLQEFAPAAERPADRGASPLGLPAF